VDELLEQSSISEKGIKKRRNPAFDPPDDKKIDYNRIISKWHRRFIMFCWGENDLDFFHDILHDIKHRDWKKITKLLLFISLVLSMIYAVVRLVQAPSGVPVEIDVKVKSDYVLMLLQCLLGLVVMAIPSIVERRLSIDIPNNMEVVYFIFLYCAIYLGEVHNFYYLIPYWDIVLHAFSGAMLGAVGFYLVYYFNEAEQLNVELSPFFISLFAFCFSLACGAVWEIYEFMTDAVLGTNMQKFMLVGGTVLSGHAAIRDTMTDLMVDAISSLVVTLFSYFTILKDRDEAKQHKKSPPADLRPANQE